MQALIQIVEYLANGVKIKISPYIYGLLTCEGRKTCTSLSRSLDVSAKKIRSYFNSAQKSIALIRERLIMIACSLPKSDEPRVLVIDGTMLSKQFARKIDHLSTDYDGVTRRVVQGLSIIVIALICGGSLIPLDFSFWGNKAADDKKYRQGKSRSATYKTKIELAMELIDRLRSFIDFAYIAMDGAFSSEAMIAFLEKYSLKYTMLIPRNRKILIDGIEMLIGKHPKIRLIRNERSKEVQASYKGHKCFITAQKRKKRNGTWETFYIISNMHLSAKEHVNVYLNRWPIDKSFRTMKQYLGLRDCQMCSHEKQTCHLFSVFLAYAIATLKQIAKKEKSVERILSFWRRLKKFQKSRQNDDLEII